MTTESRRFTMPVADVEKEARKKLIVRLLIAIFIVIALYRYKTYIQIYMRKRSDERIAHSVIYVYTF